MHRWIQKSHRCIREYQRCIRKSHLYISQMHRRIQKNQRWSKTYQRCIQKVHRRSEMSQWGRRSHPVGTKYWYKTRPSSFLPPRRGELSEKEGPFPITGTLVNFVPTGREDEGGLCFLPIFRPYGTYPYRLGAKMNH